MPDEIRVFNFEFAKSEILPLLGVTTTTCSVLPQSPFGQILELAAELANLSLEEFVAQMKSDLACLPYAPGKDGHLKPLAKALARLAKPLGTLSPEWVTKSAEFLSGHDAAANAHSLHSTCHDLPLPEIEFALPLVTAIVAAIDELELLLTGKTSLGVAITHVGVKVGTAATFGFFAKKGLLWGTSSLLGLSPPGWVVALAGAIGGWIAAKASRSAFEFQFEQAFEEFEALTRLLPRDVDDHRHKAFLDINALLESARDAYRSKAALPRALARCELARLGFTDINSVPLFIAAYLQVLHSTRARLDRNETRLLRVYRRTALLDRLLFPSSQAPVSRIKARFATARQLLDGLLFDYYQCITDEERFALALESLKGKGLRSLHITRLVEQLFAAERTIAGFSEHLEILARETRLEFDQGAAKRFDVLQTALVKANGAYKASLARLKKLADRTRRKFHISGNEPEAIQLNGNSVSATASSATLPA